jgi:hypothetical protein
MNMSNVKKVVKISEKSLVDLIDKIVTEAVQIKKKEWISEQASKNNDKLAIIEGKLKNLEEKIGK